MLMTCIVSVYNKNGIAIASDSTATLFTNNGPKYFNANKIFQLSDYMGMATFGLSEFMQVPIEIIFSEFKRKGKKKCKDSIHVCIDTFVKFINSQTNIPSVDFTIFCEIVFNGIVNEIQQGTNNKIASDGLATLSDEDIKSLMSSVLLDIYSKVKEIIAIGNVKKLEGLTAESKKGILDVRNQNINSLLDKFLPSLDKTESNLDMMNFLFETSLEYPFFFQSNKSGIVVFGYGKNEIYPGLRSIDLFFKIGGSVIYQNMEDSQIGRDNITAGITPLAQFDVVDTVIRGLNVITKEVIKSEFNKNLTFNKETNIMLIDKLDGILEVQRNNYINGFLQAVNFLYVDELHLIAETLVNISSFKKRMSMDAETIGGPIDVAIITKTGGFSWIKKKFNFDNLKDEKSS